MRIYKKVLWVGLCMMFFACSSPQNEVEIVVAAQGIEDGKELGISLGCTHAPEPDITTATLADGKATFRFVSEGPRMYYIKVKDSYGLLKIMADQGDHVKVRVKADTIPSSNGRIHYVYRDLVVNGSAIHKEYDNRNIDIERLEVNYPHRESRFAPVLLALQKATTQQQRDSVMATPLGRMMLESETNFNQMVSNLYEKCFRENGDSWWGPLLMLDNMNYFSDEMREIYGQFSERAKESYYGRIAHDLLYPSERETE